MSRLTTVTATAGSQGVTLTQCQRRESFVKNFINTEIISVKSKGIFYAREKSRN